MKGTREMPKVVVGGGFVLLLVLTLVGLAAGQTCVEPPMDLISWWPADGNAVDLVAGHNGTLVNGAMFAAGQVGQAFSLDGINDFVSVPDSTDFAFGTSDFTIDLWVNFASVRPGPANQLPNVFIAQDERGFDFNKWVFFHGSCFPATCAAGLRFHINDPVGGPLFLGSNLFSPIIGRWHHVAVTRSGTIYQFYVDGAALVEPTVSAGRPIPNANAPLTIGQAEDLGFLHGGLDEVQIYHRALSAGEIAAIFNAGSLGKCKTPVADAGPDQTVNEGTVVTLDGSGSKRSLRPLVTYDWEQIAGPPVTLNASDPVHPFFTAPPVTPGGAALMFQLTVTDAADAVSTPDEVTVNVQDVNDPPNCTLAQASPDLLWPPNHRLEQVTITGVSDPNNNPVTISITGVTQDEPVNGLGDGDTSPDAVIQGSTVLLRAERSGLGNGRVYQVSFAADDGQGSTCNGSVLVVVPHGMKPGQSTIDDGQFYNSTLP